MKRQVPKKKPEGINVGGNNLKEATSVFCDSRSNWIEPKCKNATKGKNFFFDPLRTAAPHNRVIKQQGNYMANEINTEAVDAKIAASEARAETKIETLRGEINSGFARVETSFAKQEANFAKHRVWIMATSIGTVTFLSVVIGLFGE